MAFRFMLVTADSEPVDPAVFTGRAGEVQERDAAVRRSCGEKSGTPGQLDIRLGVLGPNAAERHNRLSRRQGVLGDPTG